MSSGASVLAELTAAAQTADDMHARSRAMLVDAVRVGAAAGLTQREIASAIGRSQPEVSRLLRFHGRTPRARALASARTAVLRAIRSFGGRDAQVFGSVAAGTDTDESDIDLLVTFEHVPSLVTLARLERDLGRLTGVKVDVTPASHLPPHISRRLEQEAVPL